MNDFDDDVGQLSLMSSNQGKSPLKSLPQPPHSLGWLQFVFFQPYFNDENIIYLFKINSSLDRVNLSKDWYRLETKSNKNKLLTLKQLCYKHEILRRIEDNQKRKRLVLEIKNKTQANNKKIVAINRQEKKMKEKQEQIKILQWELLDIQYQKASNNIKNLINHTLNIYEKNSNPLDPKSESFYRYYYSIFGGQPVKRQTQEKSQEILVNPQIENSNKGFLNPEGQLIYTKGKRQFDIKRSQISIDIDQNDENYDKFETSQVSKDFRIKTHMQNSQKGQFFQVNTNKNLMLQSKPSKIRNSADKINLKFKIEEDPIRKTILKSKGPSRSSSAYKNKTPVIQFKKVEENLWDSNFSSMGLFSKVN